MRTEELIASLARGGHPVERIGSPRRRLAAWMLSAVATLVVSVVTIGPRADVIVRLLDPLYTASAFAIVLLMISGAAAALSLSVPNDARTAWTKGVPLTAGLLWLGVVAGGLAAAGSVVGQLRNEPAHPFCLFQIAVVGLVPAVWLWRELRRAAPLEPCWTGALALSAAVAVGAASAAMTCPIDRAAHQIWWHLAPVFAFTACGVPVGALALGRLR